MRPPASDFTSTPHSPCSITGAVKMRSRSRASARSRCEGPAAAAVRSAAAARVAALRLFDGIQRLDDPVDRRGVDLGGALVAVPPREGVGAVFREDDLLLLAFVEL